MLPLLNIIALTTETVSRWRQGQPDAYGCAPERGAVSTGEGTPCRHCLAQVPEGRSFLIVAHRPFAGLNPYTETGPVFVCAEDCPRGGSVWPGAMLTARSYIVRGYSRDERIIYGSGGVVATDAIGARCAALLDDAETGFVHVRSASNTCFFFRVEREET